AWSILSVRLLAVASDGLGVKAVLARIDRLGIERHARGLRRCGGRVESLENLADDLRARVVAERVVRRVPAPIDARRVGLRLGLGAEAFEVPDPRLMGRVLRDAGALRLRVERVGLTRRRHGEGISFRDWRRGREAPAARVGDVGTWINGGVRSRRMPA